MAIRDFTGETIHQFENYIDSYFDESRDRVKRRWDRFLEWLGVYDTKNAHGDVEKYIRSLKDKKDIVYKQILETWAAIAHVEESYCFLFSRAGSLFHAQGDILEQFTNTIDLDSFSKGWDADKVLLGGSDSYMEFSETRAREILDKPCEDWTDEDIATLAYASVTTTDKTLKEKIINSFYSDVSDQAIQTTKFSDRKGNQVPFKYMKRNQEQWEKFRACSDYYFAEKYNKYLSGELSDVEINTYLKNILGLNFLDEHGKAVLTAGEKAVSFNANGEIVLYEATDEHIVVNLDTAKKLPNGQYFELGIEQLMEVHANKVSMQTEVTILNGAEAAEHINDELSTKLVVDESIDYRKFLVKYGSKAVGLIPKVGPVLSKAISYTDKVVSAAERINEYYEDSHFNGVSDYEKADYSWFIKGFNIKCVEIGDSYMMLPTEDTASTVQKFMDWLGEEVKMNPENERLADMYNRLTINSCPVGKETISETEWFLANVDVSELKAYLKGAGKLNYVDDNIF